MHASSVQELSALIQSRHKCRCRFVRSVRVRKTFQGRVLWQGQVGVFRLGRGRTSTECYGWTGDALLGTADPVIVESAGSVNSPTAAVELYIVQHCE
jgi:hypothetical protein